MSNRKPTALSIEADSCAATPATRLCFLAILFLALPLSCSRKPASESYFPETGPEALHQRSLDLRSNLSVLSIALEPGFEDLETLAYFRMARGARIVSAYVTNGEASESDLGAEYPPYLAAIRRQEAARALSVLDGEVRFLNMPAVVAARDSAKIRQVWPADSLRTRLADLFTSFQPDIVLLAPDWAAPENSLRRRILRSDVLAVARQGPVAGPADGESATNSHPIGPVGRIYLQDGMSNGSSLPTNEVHPYWKQSYTSIGQRAAQAYASLGTQRLRWRSGAQPSYELIYSRPDLPAAEMEAAGPSASTPRLERLAAEIDNLSAATLRGDMKGALPRIVILLDSIAVKLGQRHLLQPEEVRRLSRWKRGLEDLRCTLLGVEVETSLSDRALTASQLTYLTVDRVEGIRGEGETSIFFSGLGQNWVINEAFDKKWPLKLHEPYRLLSPRQIRYNFPPALYGVQSPDMEPNFMFFVIHRAASREQSFIYRRRIRFTFAPRFIAEVLTPLVRMVPGERIVIRLMNLSRDGVTDSIQVVDSLATSAARPFRLSRKEATHLDTLKIRWKGDPNDGSYLIPVKINGITVARFAARKFDAKVDPEKRVGLLATFDNSPVGEALRRLNLSYTRLEPGPKLSQQIESLDVVIVDRRLLTLRPGIAEYKEELQRFVKNGGHLIVLAQDADAWNARPLWDGLRLKPTQSYDERIPLLFDATHQLLSDPNSIVPEDWNDWLFRRAYNVVTSELDAAEMPIRVQTGEAALLLTIRNGSGRQTYVDLALTPQLMNVHAGTFRLLANLISY